MVYKGRILASAERELEDIVSYLVEFGMNTAKDFLDAYEEQLNLICSGSVSYALSRMPELARLGYHTALFESYLFLYYMEDEMVVVAHVFHQRQDYASLV